MWQRNYRGSKTLVFDLNKRISDEKTLKENFTNWLLSGPKPSSTYSYLTSSIDSLNRSFENLDDCVDSIFEIK
jgi:hypothetical protein